MSNVPNTKGPDISISLTEICVYIWPKTLTNTFRCLKCKIKLKLNGIGQSVTT